MRRVFVSSFMVIKGLWFTITVLTEIAFVIEDEVSVLILQ
jgi:hypothetical protein